MNDELAPEGLELGEGRLDAQDGVALFYRFWRPASPQGVVVLAHGAGEHCGRFDHVARILARHGLAVYGYDQRGLGRSGGTRGHLERVGQYGEDLARIIALAVRLSPGLPVGLYGHSMGGQVVLSYAIQHPEGLHWVVATSPWLELSKKVPVWQEGLGRLLSRVWPSFTMPAGVPASYLAHPQEVGRAYLADPYVVKKVSARWYTELVAGARQALVEAPRLQVPLLLLQAGDDRLVVPAASERFYRQAGSPDKTFRAYPGLYHELHNEPEGPEIVGEAAAWIKQRLPAAK